MKYYIILYKKQSYPKDASKKKMKIYKQFNHVLFNKTIWLEFEEQLPIFHVHVKKNSPARGKNNPANI